eukprot:TRINITY_DN3007_c0_g3_i1.p1 TRINITY_DN3007_c0_g3~~TRINITY_DN3007_c0_g3_i1.p1  ORF type:complete len:426 (-),score=74.22 TRINITY_DN3007_c0_g3_i1:30-1307(-)
MRRLRRLLKEQMVLGVKYCGVWIFGATIYDHHAHIAGIGHSDSGCCIHSSMTGQYAAWLHPLRRAKFWVFMKASGIQQMDLDEEVVDRAYIERLVRMLRAIRDIHGVPIKMFVLALDSWYEEDGSVNVEKTGIFIPNDWIFKLVSEYPDVLLPTCSVHPYRNDAADELQRCYDQGARLCKWLPNSMGMDPSHKKCDIFFAKMKELGMVLLSHTGREHSIDIQPIQSLGNPMLLRHPLDKGVKVIAAHCASEGCDADLDTGSQKSTSSFDLWVRLMEQEEYKGLLFADISATTAFRRLGKPLTTILSRGDLHPRLVHGSDYPVPAIRLVVRTSSLLKNGYITEEQKAPLDEIYEYNPLLFDLVVKRTIKSPETGTKYPPTLFGRNDGLSELYPEENEKPQQPPPQQPQQQSPKQQEESREKERETS